ncbi:hypothetical protein [Thermoclostridium stercorarium]
MIRVYIRMPVILTSQQNKGDYMFKVAIGQDSHRFDFDNHDKKLVLGGVFLKVRLLRAIATQMWCSMH